MYKRNQTFSNDSFLLSLQFNELLNSKLSVPLWSIRSQNFLPVVEWAFRFPSVYSSIFSTA